MLKKRRKTRPIIALTSRYGVGLKGVTLWSDGGGVGLVIQVQVRVIRVVQTLTRNQGFMAHLIYRPQMYRIDLKCTDRPQMHCLKCTVPQMYRLGSNVQIGLKCTDWPQMYRIGLICTDWPHMYYASNVQNLYI